MCLQEFHRFIKSEARRAQSLVVRSSPFLRNHSTKWLFEPELGAVVLEK